MPSAEDAPVSDAEAATLFAPLRDRAGLVLAVSGGPDSSALLVLYARARDRDPRLPPATVVTVDHRLRPEAADEARLVAALAARHGLSHRTLVRDGETPRGDLQAAARRARYGLLVDAARDAGFDTVVTAHHADDQAETFLSRLARGSGVVGLAAMAPRRPIDGLVLARPFLGLPGARLRATLVAAGETWVEDPSNHDRRFGRVRLRAAAPLLTDIGLTRERLVATARAMARAAAAIEREVEATAAVAVAVHPAGWATIRPDILADRAEEVRLRLLSRVIRAIGGAPYGPRLEAVEAAAAAFAAAGATGIVPARTLGGVRLEQRRGRIWIAAEPGRGAGTTLRLEPGGSGRWCGRRIDLGREAPRPVTIARLGAAGRCRLAAAGGVGCPGETPPPAAVIESAPAVFVDGALAACPGLGFVEPAAAAVCGHLTIAPIDLGFAAPTAPGEPPRTER